MLPSRRVEIASLPLRNGLALLLLSACGANATGPSSWAGVHLVITHDANVTIDQVSVEARHDATAVVSGVRPKIADQPLSDREEITLFVERAPKGAFLVLEIMGLWRADPIARATIEVKLRSGDWVKATAHLSIEDIADGMLRDADGALGDLDAGVDAKMTACTTGWTAIPSVGSPSPRSGHTVVWTGSEMIVWGGSGGGLLNDGARYNPSLGTWSALPTAGAPPARAEHTAVWTDSEMIIFGGSGTISGFYVAQRYIELTDSWVGVALLGTPSLRIRHTAIWTGSEMIVWGGLDSNNVIVNDGARYDPVDNAWTPVAMAGAPEPRQLHSAVWTGSEMIVWGGVSSLYLQTGGRYDPDADAWASTAMTSPPSSREDHIAVWTGSEMIVWGGFSSGFTFNDGGRYHPTDDSWSPLLETDLASREGHVGIWTGSAMIVWGGWHAESETGIALGDGALYDVSSGWTLIPTTDAPSGRMGAKGVWSGSELIVWGGFPGELGGVPITVRFGWG